MAAVKSFSLVFDHNSAAEFWDRALQETKMNHATFEPKNKIVLIFVTEGHAGVIFREFAQLPSF